MFINYDPLCGMSVTNTPLCGAIIADLDDVLFAVANGSHSAWSCTLDGAKNALLDGAYLASVQGTILDDDWQYAVETVYQAILDDEIALHAPFR